MWCVLQTVRTCSGQKIALACKAEQLVSSLHQRRVTGILVVANEEVETGRVAETLNGGRIEGDDIGIPDGCQTAHGTSDDRLRAGFRAYARLHILELDERDRNILALACEIEADNTEHAGDIVCFLCAEVFNYSVEHFAGSIGRCPRWKLDAREDAALILLRQEPGRQSVQQRDGACQKCHE